MAELTGVKNITVHKSQCYAKGGPCCEWLVKWQ